MFLNRMKQATPQTVLSALGETHELKVTNGRKSVGQSSSLDLLIPSLSRAALKHA